MSTDATTTDEVPLASADDATPTETQATVGNHLERDAATEIIECHPAATHEECRKDTIAAARRPRIAGSATAQ